MEKNSSIKWNFVMHIFLSMSSFLFPLISFPYVSRILLPAGTGKVSFAISVIAYFNMFAQLGIPTYGIRACAKVRDDKLELSKTVHELLIINLLMSLIAYAFLGVSIATIERIREDKTLICIVSITILLNTIGIEWMYKGLEKYTYITIRSIIFKLIALVSMFLFVKTKEDYIAYGVISIFASSASNILNFINARKYIKIYPFHCYDIKRHIKPVLIFFAMACATTIYTNLDTVMLGFMANNDDVGYYNAAIKIKNVLISIVASLGTVLLPRNSYYIEHGLLDKFWSISKRAINFVFVLALPLMLYFIIFAKESILFLSGNEFYGAILPMQVLMPTILAIGITNILGLQVLVPLGKERIVLYSEILGAIIDFTINLLLIPNYHATGAAIGTLAAEIIVFCFQYRYLREKVRLFFKNVSWKSICAGISVSILSVIPIKICFSNIFFKLLVSSLVFFCIYFCTLLVSKEPLAIDTFESVRKRFHKF